MATLSITKAWSETVAFMQRESGLVLPIAFLLVSLPGAALQYAMPTPQPGAPFDLAGWMQDIRTVMLFLPVVAILSLIGTIAINYLAIEPGRTVAEALQVGARRFIFLFLAWLLLGIVAAAACLPLFLLVPGFGFGGGQGSVGLLVLLLLIYLILLLAASIRLMLGTPVCAAESVGPVGILMRSWELTRGHFWKLLGFVLLFWLAAFVAIIAISAVIGIVIVIATGPPLPGSAGAFVVLLLSAVLQAVVTALFATMVARIYVQLAGTGHGEIFG
jgi:Membrane domain of glycerophosphoryl diester phosphodiesterase